jgi:hypothetical protein
MLQLPSDLRTLGEQIADALSTASGQLDGE